MFLFQKVRLPTEIPQHEEEREHEHIDRRRKAGPMVTAETKIEKKNIFSKYECPSYDLSDAEHMGAKPGVLQHRAKNDHKE